VCAAFLAWRVVRGAAKGGGNLSTAAPDALCERSLFYRAVCRLQHDKRSGRSLIGKRLEQHNFC